MANLRNNQNGNSGALFIIVLLLVLGVGFWYLMQEKDSLNITNFRQCVAAGNPVQESYPEVCVTQDGRSFANPAQDIDSL